MCVQSEELTLLLIQLRRQQSELTSARQLSLTQLLCLSRDTPNAKVSTCTGVVCTMYVCVLHCHIHPLSSMYLCERYSNSCSLQCCLA